MTNSMAIGSYGFDPYFMQAYQTPNYYAGNYMAQNNVPAATTALPSANTTTSTTTATATNNQQNVNFKGKEKEKSNSTAWAILGTVAVIGAACLCKKAYNKGVGDTVLAKVKDGFSKMWSGAKTSVTNLIKDQVTVTKNGDDIICNLPNKTNFLRGDNIADDIAKLGGSAEIPALSDAGSKLRRYTFDADGFTFEVVKGKITKCTSGADDYLKIFQEDANMKSKVEKMVKEFAQGKNLDQLRNIKYSNNANGISRLYEVANSTETAKLIGGATHKFNAASDAVKAYRSEHANFDQLLKNVTEGKLDGLKIATADYGTSIGTFKIVNGDVSGIQIGNTFYPKGSDKFKALKFDNENLFKEVLEKQKDYTNLVWKT